MTTPPSPSSASRPLPAALSEKIDACIDARGAWAHAVRDTMDGAGTLADEDEAESAYYAARASLDAALRGMLDDAEDNRNAQSLALIAVMEHHGNRALEMSVALLECAAELRWQLHERRAARAARPEASADA